MLSFTTFFVDISSNMNCFEIPKQCMAKRFDGSQQALDLNNIRTDPGNDMLHFFYLVKEIY